MRKTNPSPPADPITRPLCCPLCQAEQKRGLLGLAQISNEGFVSIRCERHQAVIVFQFVIVPQLEREKR